MTYLPVPTDPLPGIESALLSAADIRAYQDVLSTGGLPIFDPWDDRKLKPASYEIPFQGTVYSWEGKDDDEPREVIAVDEGGSYTIKKNTIVFFMPKVKIKLPPYLAIRFNLHIKLIHRGLLLGTGPLVDPGFEGQLLIPLHNLTTNEYTIRGSDGLIWVEFTKLSKFGESPDFKRYVDVAGRMLEKKTVTFDPGKKKQTADDYFARANFNRPIASSLVPLLKKAQDANEAAEDMRRFFTLAGTFTVAGVVLAAVGLAVSLFGLINDVNKSVQDVRVKADGTQISTDLELRQIKAQVTELQSQLRTLTHDIESPQKASTSHPRDDATKSN